MKVLTAYVALAQCLTLAHAVPVRTVGEQPYRIRELRVRFFRADMMFKPPPEVQKPMLALSFRMQAAPVMCKSICQHCDPPSLCLSMAMMEGALRLQGHRLMSACAGS